MAFWNRKQMQSRPGDSWLYIMAPLDGEVLSLSDVPDPVFSQRMVGDGAAILPSSETVLSPVAGVLTHLFPTGHAAGVTTDDGVEILLHIGMDTVELKGEGFRKIAVQGQRIDVGAPLIEIDLQQLQTAAKSVITPVVITNFARVEEWVVTEQTQVRAGIDWLIKVKQKE